MIKLLSSFTKTLLAAVFLLPAGSCRKKEMKVESANSTLQACSPSYATDIKPFIISKCAVSGCHISGASFGDFTTYEALKQRVSNGRVKSLVYELKIMPPANAAKLSAEELDKLTCWMDNGAIQN